MHRKIRVIVAASSVKQAVEKSINGLENGMDNDILADGSLTTLVGDYTPLSPTTYFTYRFSKPAYPLHEPEAVTNINETIDHTKEYQKTFCFYVDDDRGVIPLPTCSAITETIGRLNDADSEYWVSTFDLRYDFDATPHKPHEILEH